MSPDNVPGALVVVTGMTGAGRSTAAKELEDLGYYVVDNLPPDLIREVVDSVDRRIGPEQPIALVVDIRSGLITEDLLRELATSVPGRRPTVLFLEADDEVLVRRQEAARRPHPLQGDGRLLDGIQAEREAIAPLREDAGLLIETTDLNPHQLKAKVAEAFGTPGVTALRATVLSFGFKYGLPVDADLVADMRFLPNPYWHPSLRDKNGRDEDVATYVTSRPAAQAFLEDYMRILETVMDGYQHEGKRFMTVAIGCTGGKHRSVAMSEELARRLREAGVDALAEHRDLGRE